MKNGSEIVPTLAIAVPTPKASERLSGSNRVATVLIVKGVCTASVAPSPIRAATTCQAEAAQPFNADVLNQLGFTLRARRTAWSPVNCVT